MGASLRPLITGLVLVIAGLMSDTPHAGMVIAIGLLLVGVGLLGPQIAAQIAQERPNAAILAPAPQRELWQRERIRERRVRHWPL